MSNSQYLCVLLDNYSEDSKMIFTFLACKNSLDWAVLDVVPIVDSKTSKPSIEFNFISIESIYLNYPQNQFFICFYL